MKIATLAVSPTAFLHLKGPDGQLLYDDGKPVGIDLYGPGSDEAAAIESAQSARTIKRMQDNDMKIAVPSVETQREETTADLVAYTAAFRHLEHDGPDGQPLVGNHLAAAIYSDPKFGWVKPQVMKFVADWGKFMPGSPIS
ncbi:hypothetical protein QCD71_12385 [Sphingomonas sp. PsM26]|jgi:hypothetical protein|nr:hypothetical protein [Sphingomonas sp. PsM26]